MTCHLLARPCRHTATLRVPVAYDSPTARRPTGSRQQAGASGTRWPAGIRPEWLVGADKCRPRTATSKRGGRRVVGGRRPARGWRRAAVDGQRPAGSGAGGVAADSSGRCRDGRRAAGAAGASVDGVFGGAARQWLAGGWGIGQSPAVDGTGRPPPGGGQGHSGRVSGGPATCRRTARQPTEANSSGGLRRTDSSRCRWAGGRWDGGRWAAAGGYRGGQSAGYRHGTAADRAAAAHRGHG